MRAACLISAWLICALTCAAAEPPPTFVAAREVLERHCLWCHQGAEPEGGLSLATPATAFRGGDGGPCIVPGKVGESWLLDMVSGEPPEMPKKQPPLKANEVETLRRWIAAGAPWPDGIKLVDRRFEGQRWWSLERLTRPAVPTFPAGSAEAHWVRNPIDAFILQELQQRGLQPSPEADPRTLIRRVTYDLTGLPPTVEEVEEFVSRFSLSLRPSVSPSLHYDGETEGRRDGENGYNALIDRLLASPRYGERWARHWLDVVHYGETHGYDKDKPRLHAWPYRDYVIRAFNDDKPYGRFVAEQVAGDALFPGTRDGIEALGFIAAGPWDLIGHAEVPESKIDGKIARHLDRDDMVVNTIQTFNGLTVQCAQCHDHKFDPITQEDYYSLQAVFAAVDRTDKRYDVDPATAARRTELTARRDTAMKQLATIEADVAAQAGVDLADLDQRLRELEKRPRAKSADQQSPAFGYHSGLVKQADTVKWVQIDLKRPTKLQTIVLRPCHDDFNQIGDGFGFPVRFRVEIADDAQFTQHVRLLHDATTADVEKPGLTPLNIPGNGQIARFVRVTATKLRLRLNDYMLALSELEALDEQGRNVAAGAEVQSLDSIEAPPRWRRANLTDGAYPQATDDTPQLIAGLKQQREQLWMRAATEQQRSQRNRLLAELARLDSELNALPQQVVYVAAVHTGTGSFRGTGPDGGKPRPVYILARGNVLKPGEEVGPGALTAVAGLECRFQLPAGHGEADRRAALARWLTDLRNPLTWRSIVNRVWLYHFGRGIVDTPNDFGRNGALPSHPALLDWLACELRDGEQSLKSLHRLIVTSATYRQRSIADFGLRIADSTKNEKQRTKNLNPNPQSAIHNPQSIDPDNRLLSRMNRRRLEAEAVRDGVLFVAGRLDPRMGGPSFQDFVIEKPEHSPHYEYDLHDPNDPRSHRRSIYRFIVRSQQQPFMTTLDCADPSMQVDKRNESLSSLQALALLNNGFMVTMSRHFAARLEAEAGDLTSRVDRAVLLALNRPATADERAQLIAYAERHGLANLCRALFNLNEFVFVD